MKTLIRPHRDPEKREPDANASPSSTGSWEWLANRQGPRMLETYWPGGARALYVCVCVCVCYQVRGETRVVFGLAQIWWRGAEATQKP